MFALVCMQISSDKNKMQYKSKKSVSIHTDAQNIQISSDKNVMLNSLFLFFLSCKLDMAAKKYKINTFRLACVRQHLS
jgi:hypothetical protein